MESSSTSVLNKLAQVYELAWKLSDNLQQPSQIELGRTIVEEIIGSVEKAIHMVKSTGGGGGGSDGELQFSNSTGRYNEDQQMLKKRKMLPTWTSQVSASTLRGSEGLPEDGYTWRKYGQKKILNAKYPRAYYRCTHRRKQGCLAMKQVQRSDDDPSVFEITYRGTHMCSSIELQNPYQSLFDETNNMNQVELQDSFRVLKTEGLDLEAQDSTSLIFFHSTPLNPEEDLFYSSPNLESCFPASFSSAFVSPTTSESNCPPSSPCQKSSQENPSADLTDTISMANPITNSTMIDVDFLLRDGEMDTYFPIEISDRFEWNSTV